MWLQLTWPVLLMEMRMETGTGSLWLQSQALLTWINLLFMHGNCNVVLKSLGSRIIFFGIFSSNAVCPDIRERKLLSESLHIFTKRFFPSDPCHSIIGHFPFSSVKNGSKTLKFTTEQHYTSGKMYLMHSAQYGLFFYFQHT